MSRGGHDVPLLRGSFTIRSPRSVLLLHPLQMPLVVSLLLISIVFTVWPQALEHDPIGFEQRGWIHHVWHYTLLAGSGVTLWGMLSAGRQRLKVELMGLSLLTGMLGMNLVAVTTEAQSGNSEISGLYLAFAASGIVGLLVRAYTLATEPTVDLPTVETTGD